MSLTVEELEALRVDLNSIVNRKSRIVALNPVLAELEAHQVALNQDNDRVAALLSTLGNGAALPNHRIMTAGQTWANFLTAFNASAAGGTIWLPPGEIIQTSTLQITKSINIIGHPDGTSKLKIQSNPQLLGASRQIFIDKFPASGQVDGVTLANFTMEHDRAVMGTAGRTLTIDFGRCKNINIRNMTFRNITADVFIFSMWTPVASSAPSVENVHIDDCTVNEWYESVVNIHGAGSGSAGGGVNGLYVNNINAVTTARHPNSGVSSPYGFLVEATAPTLLENVYLSRSTLTGTGSANNSFGIFINVEGSPNPFYRFDKIHCNGNTVSGFMNALIVRNGQNVGGVIPVGPSRMYFNNNTLSSSATFDEHPIVRLFPQGVAATDILTLVGNTLIRTNGGQPIINEPAHTGAVATKVGNTVL